MKKLYIFLILHLVLIINIYGQEKMQKGYYIDNHGKRIDGFIKVVTSTSYCQEIFFAKEQNSKVKKYLPENVKEYHITASNKKFKSHKITQEEPQDSTFNRVFIEVLVETSTHSLYLYQPNSVNKRLFIETPEIDFLELKTEVKTKTVSGLSHEYSNKKYIGLLKVAFPDCPITQKLALDELRFKIVPISQAFIKLCKCSNQETKFTSSTSHNKGTTQIIFGAGLSYSITHINSLRNPSYVGHLPNPKGLFGVPVSISLSYFPPNIKNTFFIGFGSHYNLKGSYSEVSEIIFEQHYLGANLFAGYQYPFGKIRPYFGGELTLGFLLNSQNAFRSTNPAGTSFRIYRTTEYEGQATEFGLGIFFGADIPLSRHGVKVEFKYNYGSMPIINPALIFSQHSIQLLIKFRLTTSKKHKQQ